jgi:hypothetical protein
VNQIAVNSIDTLATANRIEASSSKAASGTDDVVRILGQMSLSLESNSLKQDQFILAHSVRSQNQDQIGLSVEEISHKQERMMLAVTEYSQRQEETQKQMLQHMQLLLDQSQPRKIASLAAITSLHTRLTQVPEVQLVDAPIRSCTCRAVHKAHSLWLTSMVRYTKTYRAQHFSYCAAYRTSEQGFTQKIQFIPPSWLLLRTFDLGTQVKNLWSMKPSTICPIMYGTSRLVDPKTSPAFRAIEVADGKLPNVLADREAIMTGLESTLRDLFVRGQASVLDTDRHGRTLLTVGTAALLYNFRPRTDKVLEGCSHVCVQGMRWL